VFPSECPKLPSAKLPENYCVKMGQGLEKRELSGGNGKAKKLIFVAFFQVKNINFPTHSIRT
jgi:hypothetical protein